MDKHLVDLIRIGFRKIGEWKVTNSVLKIDYLAGDAAQEIIHGSPALYAFAVGDALRYVGKTTQPLMDRLYGYEKPGNDQATNQKCHNKVLEAITAGESVSIYGFSPNVPFYFDRFKIDLPAGLEDALIKAMDPKWNGKQNGKRLTETEEIETVVSNSSVL